jgi:hypothetical protein
MTAHKTRVSGNPSQSAIKSNLRNASATLGSSGSHSSLGSPSLLSATNPNLTKTPVTSGLSSVGPSSLGPSSLGPSSLEPSLINKLPEFSLKNKIANLKKWYASKNFSLYKKTIKTPFQIKNFKNINQYIKKDFIYIDITKLLGETFIKNITDDNCFETDILLKTIAYSLTSNNRLDKPRIIYFLKNPDGSSSSTKKTLYVYNTKEYKSYKKEIT